MPSAYTNDIDLYCTHGDLADEVGGARKLAKLIPPDDVDDATSLVRTQALRDVYKALKRRTPPVFESQITDPSELKDAVAYGALMRLYRSAMTTPDDVNASLFREYRGHFETEILSMRLTLEDSSSVDVGGIRIWRG